MRVLFVYINYLIVMKSSSTQHRTTSTAINSSSKLPKINTAIHQESSPIINKKLFSENRSLVLTSRNKNNFRERIKTEVQPQRHHRPFTYKHQMVEDMGMRRLEQEIASINQMFKLIQKLRQTHGIVSINQKGEEEQRYGEDSNQVPYDPRLHQMNEQIFQIKCQIEQHLEEVFRISKQYPRLKHLIEGLLEQHMHDFLRQNSRNGKIAAMKAQHRLIQASQTKLARLCRQ